jgi:cbb3-type cytochrome oxidase subunit 3
MPLDSVHNFLIYVHFIFNSVSFGQLHYKHTAANVQNRPYGLRLGGSVLVVLFMVVFNGVFLCFYLIVYFFYSESGRETYNYIPVLQLQ